MSALGSILKHMRLKTVKPKKQLLIISLSLVVFILCALLAASYKLVGPEKSIFYFIYGWPEPLLPIFWFITQWGGLWVFLAAVLVFFGQRKKHLAAKLAICGTASHFLVQILKALIERPRPEFLLGDVVPKDSMVAGLGFPSGHTAGITIIALVIAPYLKKKYRWMVYLAILAVAISRIYLGVHTPLDVIGGFFLGIIIVKGYELILLMLKLEKTKRQS